MSEIDKLLIAVGIDEGSKLDELYNMLKQLQSVGKIEIEIPDMPTKGQLSYIRGRIKILTDMIKPMINKFPEIEESLKDIVENALKEGANDLRNFLKTEIEQIETIASYAHEASIAITDFISIIATDLQNIKDLPQFDRIMSELAKIKGAVDGQGNKLAGDFVIMKNEFNNLHEEIIDKYSEYIKDYFAIGEDIKHIEGRLDKIHLERTDIQEAIRNSIRNRFDEFRRKDLPKITVTMSPEWREFISNTFEQRLIEFKEKLDDKLETVVDNLRERIENIDVIMGPEWSREVDTIVEKKLAEFKNKLDDNLESVIDIGLNTFFDTMSAVKTQKTGSIWKAPGVKPFEEKGSMSGQSGFFRMLASFMLTTSPEFLKGMTGFMMSRGFGRTIEEHRGAQLEESLRFLGLEMKKGEQPIETIKRIVDQIQRTNLNIKDIIGSTSDDVKSIKSTLTDPKPQERLDNKDEQIKGT